MNCESSNNTQQKLLIEMVMRQTNYTYDEAKLELEQNDNNYVEVIKKALGIVTAKKESVNSVNQHIYKEIRGLMDTASSSHRRTQEMELKKQEYILMLKKQLEEQKKNKSSKLPKLEEETDEESGNVSPTDEAVNTKI